MSRKYPYALLQITDKIIDRHKAVFRFCRQVQRNKHDHLWVIIEYRVVQVKPLHELYRRRLHFAAELERARIIAYFCYVVVYQQVLFMNSQKLDFFQRFARITALGLNI
ncbi:hypothetical protein AYI69_g8134 [Smittium culicis]|uniref:Uncharacterized protein n=1 Tax=Smittium culicis TaxID=133412 RepID=A0A1R1XLU8_9FUNG|nr:hypothetical protein AYI69_g8134 [Smittium culicis]